VERRPSGRLFDDSGHAPEPAATATAQDAGRIRQGGPFDLLTLVTSLSCAWSPASSTSTAPASDASGPPPLFTFSA